MQLPKQYCARSYLTWTFKTTSVHMHCSCQGRLLIALRSVLTKLALCSEFATEFRDVGGRSRMALKANSSLCVQAGVSHLCSAFINSLGRCDVKLALFYYVKGLLSHACCSLHGVCSDRIWISIVGVGGFFCMWVCFDAMIVTEATCSATSVLSIPQFSSTRGPTQTTSSLCPKLKFHLSRAGGPSSCPWLFEASEASAGMEVSEPGTKLSGRVSQACVDLPAWACVCV